MIEKLPFETKQTEYEGKILTAKTHTNPYDMQVKINELVDAVNGILDYAPLEMAIKVEPAENSKIAKNAQDPKDIWHFPSEAPAYCFQCAFYDTVSDEYHFGQYSPVSKHFLSGNARWKHEEVQRFAFAKDMIACLDELERTKKQLEAAKTLIKEIKTVIAEQDLEPQELEQKD